MRQTVLPCEGLLEHTIGLRSVLHVLRMPKLWIHVDLLINNAGFGTHEDVLESDPAVLDEMIHLNITTLTGLTRRFAADFVECRRGVVVNGASLAALLPTPRTWRCADHEVRAEVH